MKTYHSFTELKEAYKNITYGDFGEKTEVSPQEEKSKLDRKELQGKVSKI